MTDVPGYAQRLAKVLYPDETECKATMDIVLETRGHAATVIARDLPLRELVDAATKALKESDVKDCGFVTIATSIALARALRLFTGEAGDG